MKRNKLYVKIGRYERVALDFTKNSSLVYNFALTKHGAYVSRSVNKYFFVGVDWMSTGSQLLKTTVCMYNEHVEGINRDFVIVRRRERIRAVIKINGSHGQLVYIFLPLATIHVHRYIILCYTALLQLATIVLPYNEGLSNSLNRKWVALYYSLFA